MKKNPLSIDEDGAPVCFGRCDESDKVCIEDCDPDVRDRCCDEKTQDIERIPNKLNDITNKPDCFGRLYSSYSEVCQDDCAFRYGCRRDSNADGWKKEAIEDWKQDRLHLPVLNTRPSTTIIDPPSKPVQQSYKPVPYWENTRPYTPSTYSPGYTTNTNSHQLSININRPNLSDQEYIDIYGARPARNAIVPYQFENEAWYSRLGKEFILRSVMYAVQVAGQLIVEMISRIRWAPKQ